MPEERIRNETSELRLVLEVMRALEGADGFSDHLERALAIIARHTGMMRGTLTLVDQESREIAIEASFGLKKEELGRARYRLGEGITGRVIETGQAVIVPHISEEPLFLNRTGARDLQKDDISFLCVPVMIEGRAAGALSADKLFADSICFEEDLRLLEVLATVVSRAVKVRRDVRVAQAAVIEENRRLQQLVREKFDSGPIIGNSDVMRALLREIAQVSPSNATVLLRGESGTGKELVAGLIHANSPRAGQPLVKVNCAALPEHLVENELFGHERGAFTGAVSAKKGRFETADGGTLFLDEVGELSMPAQAKLLRVLQEKEFERVGGTRTLRVDVRLVAATNQNLEDMVADGRFRQDLYYRLSVFPLYLPALRERLDDIMPLVTHFVDKYGRDCGKRIAGITAEASARLRSHHWPGNIRELENVIQRAVILCGDNGIIDRPQLPLWFQAEDQSGFTAAGTTLAEALAGLEKRLISEALESTQGNMSKAAEQLGITERIIGLRMKEYGLDYRDFRNK